MQINLTTDYALRCVIFLSQKDDYVSSKEVSDAIKISREFVQRIMQKLKKAGLVGHSMGANGGYRLAKKPDEIKLIEIFEVMEDTMRINRCMEEDTYCSIGMPESCNMHHFYEELQEKLDRYFAENTIGNILNSNYVLD